MTLYQVKLSSDLKETGQLLIGLVGTIFYLWAIWVSGIDYFLLCLIVYLLGIVLYIQARKAIGVKKLFASGELVLVVLLIAGAVLALVRLFTGQIAL